ncbi:MAG: hypothetical protein ACOCZ5_02325, partial [bacterium]
SKGIHLIHIYQDDWFFKKDVVKFKLLDILGKQSKFLKIDINDCDLKYVDIKQCEEFLKDNCLNENLGNLNIGLYYKNKLIYLLSLETIKENVWEIINFCKIINTIVDDNAFGFIFNFFIENFDVGVVICSLERSWYMNNKINLLNFVGFELVEIVEPVCYYINNNKRYIRQINDCYKIYDSGLLKYKYKRYR